MDKDLVKKNAISGMVTCGIFAVLSVVGFICIVIFDPDKSDIPLFGFVFGILLITCIFGMIKFIKQFKVPEKVMPHIAPANTSRSSYYNAEWNWDVAEANYRVQHNLTGELTEQDKDMIWKYCAAEISYFIAWLTDKDLMYKDHMNEADLESIRRREMTPDDYLIGIDMKLTEDDVIEEAWPFFEYFISDGFESIDDFIEKVSRTKTDVLSDKFTEKENRHCNFVFDWAFYDEFKSLLDREYKDYLNG